MEEIWRRNTYLYIAENRSVVTSSLYDHVTTKQFLAYCHVGRIKKLNRVDIQDIFLYLADHFTSETLSFGGKNLLKFLAEIPPWLHRHCTTM